MSVQQEGPYPMPQPEQWMSEHEPWTSLAIVAAYVLIVVLVVWWVSGAD